jgi:hypothetical protein
MLHINPFCVLQVNKQGTLVIKEVLAEDEGIYTCKPISPLGQGHPSTPVQVYVRGQSVNFCLVEFHSRNSGNMFEKIFFLILELNVFNKKNFNCKCFGIFV